MIRLNAETYLSFDKYIHYDMIISGWEVKRYWLFIIYSKKLIKQ